MAPTPGQRRDKATSSLLPLVAGICALLVVRELLPALLPRLSLLIDFLASLVVGYVTYAVVERLVARRRSQRNGNSR
jgi:peptidoglycan/LPS O-acetylase OafA/YrhL